jgi:hypothetical protein
VAQTKLDITDVQNLGLTEAFQNWISTVVDTVNENCTLIENAVGGGLVLVRADSSAPASVDISNSFKDFLKKITEAIASLEAKLQELEGK